ncbi:MAG: hypothetical protein ACRDWD_11965 [Acidimicrobiia bacterium]
MAKALECPNCRARYPIAELANEPTFVCQRCGQILKVRRTDARPDGNGGGTAVFGASAVASSSAAASDALVADPGQPASDTKSSAEAAKKARRTARRADRKLAPDHVAWPLRLLAWIVALPLGAAVVVFPARKFGLLTTFDLADVIIGTGAGRYARLAVVVVLWALAAAIFVQLFLVGGRALVNRYRKGSASTSKAERAAPKQRVSRRAAKRPTPDLEPVAAAANRPARPTARSSQRLRNTAGRRTGS